MFVLFCFPHKEGMYCNTILYMDLETMKNIDLSL